MGISKRERKPLQNVNSAEVGSPERKPQPPGKDPNFSPMQELHAVNMTLAQTMNQIDSLVLRAHKLGMRGQLAPTEIRQFATALHDVQSSMDEWSTFFDSTTSRPVAPPKAVEPPDQGHSSPAHSSSPGLIATPSPLSNGETSFLFLHSSSRKGAGDPCETSPSDPTRDPTSKQAAVSASRQPESSLSGADCQADVPHSGRDLLHQLQEVSRAETPNSDLIACSPLPPTPGFSSPLHTVQPLRGDGFKQPVKSSFLLKQPEGNFLPAIGNQLSDGGDLYSGCTIVRQSAAEEEGNSHVQFSTPVSGSPVFALSPPTTCQQLKPCWSGDSGVDQDSMLLPESPFHTPGVRLKCPPGSDSPTPPDGQLELQPNFRAPIALTPAGLQVVAATMFSSVSPAPQGKPEAARLGHVRMDASDTIPGSGTSSKEAAVKLPGKIRMRSLNLPQEIQGLKINHEGTQRTGDRVEDVYAQACAELQIADFPSFFQSGDARKQLEAVYAQFVSGNKVNTGTKMGNQVQLDRQQGMVDLIRSLPRLGEDRIALLLELLTSRGYLKRVLQNGQSQWRASS